MKYVTALLLAFSTFSYAADAEPAPRPKGEDVQVILEKTFLTAQSEPLLQMMAMEAITESQKKIEAEALVAQFKEGFRDENMLAKLGEPYMTLFSAAEVAELRKIYENPVWEKYAEHGMQVFQSNIGAIKEAFKELALNTVIAVEDEQEEIASADIVQITKDNFDETLATSKLPLIIDVNATWCGPCKMMNPIIDDLSEEYQGRVQFAKVDFDSQSELAHKYNVTSLPTILFFKPGQKTPALKNVGFISKEDLQAKIDQFLKK